MPAQNKVSSLKNESAKAVKVEVVSPQEPVKSLLEWESPTRPYKRKETEYFKTLGAILFLVCVILLFFKEWLLIAAIGAFYFITYVLGRFPPEEIKHKITTQGIITGDRVYLWRELSDFWFTQSHGQTILNVDVLPTGKIRLSGRVFILLGDQPEAKVKEIVAKYLPYREIPEKNWMDNTASWLSRKIPLEKS